MHNPCIPAAQPPLALQWLLTVVLNTNQEPGSTLVKYQMGRKFSILGVTHSSFMLSSKKHRKTKGLPFPYLIVLFKIANPIQSQIERLGSRISGPKRAQVSITSHPVL